MRHMPSLEKKYQECPYRDPLVLAIQPFFEKTEQVKL